MKVLYVTSEFAPLAKAGGLGDVAGSLPKALIESGIDVTVVMPLYEQVRANNIDLSEMQIQDCEFQEHTAKFYSAEYSKIPLILVANPEYFERSGIYSDDAGAAWEDNFQRFIFFQKAVVHFLENSSENFDVLHLNDNQSALIPAFINESNYFKQSKPKTVFTIHNLSYQGEYPEAEFTTLTPQEFQDLTGISSDKFYPLSPFEFYGKINSLKTALEFADVITTVSPSYAEEITSDENFGYKLTDILFAKKSKLFGILNGIDTEIWNPTTDNLIQANYNAENLGGKRINKQKLFEYAGFAPANIDKPLAVCISRIVPQKGWNLILDALPYLLNLGYYCAFLGEGMPELTKRLADFAKKYANRIIYVKKYDEKLAHCFEAAGDMFLMPSKYEPCGLNQMFSMIYGTVPIVHATGGLKDTVMDADEFDSGTGFVFKNHNLDSFLGCVFRARMKYSQNRGKDWRELMLRCMSQDFSWAKTSKEYIKIYTQKI